MCQLSKWLVRPQRFIAVIGAASVYQHDSRQLGRRAASGQGERARQFDARQFHGERLFYIRAVGRGRCGSRFALGRGWREVQSGQQQLFVEHHVELQGGPLKAQYALAHLIGGPFAHCPGLLSLQGSGLRFELFPDGLQHGGRQLGLDLRCAVNEHAVSCSGLQPLQMFLGHFRVSVGLCCHTGGSQPSGQQQAAGPCRQVVGEGHSYFHINRKECWGDYSFCAPQCGQRPLCGMDRPHTPQSRWEGWCSRYWRMAKAQ